MQPPANAWPWAITGVSSAIAASGTGTLTINNSSGGDFYGRRLKAIAFFDQLQSSALAGTPLASVPDATVGANTLSFNTTVTLNVKIGNQQLFTQEIDLLTLMGNEGDGFVFEDILPKVENQQDVIITITNSSAFSVKVRFSLFGFAVPRGTRLAA